MPFMMSLQAPELFSCHSVAPHIYAIRSVARKRYEEERAFHPIYSVALVCCALASEFDNAALALHGIYSVAPKLP